MIIDDVLMMPGLRTGHGYSLRSRPPCLAPQRLRAGTICAIFAVAVLCGVTIFAQVYPPERNSLELDSVAIPTTNSGDTTPIENPEKQLGLMQLHLTWGFGNESSWVSSIALSEGFIAQPIPLGNSTNTAASFFLENGELQFQSKEPGRFNGFQWTVFAPITAGVKIRLLNSTTDEFFEKTIPLAELTYQTIAFPLDSRGNRMVLRRVHGDELAVIPKHSSLVFSPDETFYLDLYPRFLSVPRKSHQQIEVSVFRARTEEKIPYLDQEIPIAVNATETRIPISIRLPHESGVYDVVLSLKQTKPEEPKGITNIFSREKELQNVKLAERTVQVVVIDTTNHWAASLREIGSLSSLKTEQELVLDSTDPFWWRPLAKSSPTFCELLRKSGAMESLDAEIQPEIMKEKPSLFKPRWSGIRGLPIKLVPLGDKNQPVATPLKTSDEQQSQESLQSLWTHGRISIRKTPFGPFTMLQNNSTESDTAWVLYPIPIRNIGEPHVLEVEYLSTDTQSLGISIVEPTKNGGLDPISLDGGVDRAEEIAGNTVSERILTHRIVFWPRTELPLVLLSNRQKQRAASFGKIRLYRVNSAFPKAFADNSQRLFAAYMHRPMFADNFGATRGISDYFLAGATDWVTFFDGVNRFADYLQCVGYNGALISVSADGSTIYPSETVASTPKFDSGVFLSEGEDPIRKDVVELIARIFDREKLTLIPAVDFNAPILRLEERIRREIQSQYEDKNSATPNEIARFAARSGYYWIDPQGKTFTQVHGTKSGRAPYYNILHPIVQEEMLSHVLELLVRYGNHSSFGGIAIQLSADGFAQLPEEQWGMDDFTIFQFQEETQTPVPSVMGENRFAERYEYIRTYCMDKWIRWRAKKVGNFYRKMSQMITHFRPDARLILSSATLFDGPSTQSAFYPTLARKTDVSQTLMVLGFDLNMLENERSLVFLRPRKTSFSGQPASTAAQREMEQADLFAPLDRNKLASGTLFYNRNDLLRLPTFEQKSPYQPSETRFIFQAVPSAEQNRKRFLRELAKSDVQLCFDGGQYVSFGQEESLTDLITVYRCLPAIPFHTFVPGRFQELPDALSNMASKSYGKIRLTAVNASAEKERKDAPMPTSMLTKQATPIQPVVVRYAHTKEETIVYFVNNAAFHVDVHVTFSAANGTRLTELTGRRKIPDPIAESNGNRLVWSVTLNPYDLLALRLSDTTSEPLEVIVKCPNDIIGPKGKLQQVFDALIYATDHPVVWNGLKNADFETISQEPDRIIGWNRIGDNTFTTTLDSERKHSGRSSLKMVCSGTSGGVLSDSFDAPQTGRLFVNLWLGLDEKTQQCPLRIALTGLDRNAKAPFLRTVLLEQTVLAASSKVPPLDGVRWCSVRIPFTLLPLTSLENLAIHLDMTAEGTVWVDDIRLESVAFTESERIELLKMISVASYLPSNNRISESIELLEGFWSQLLLENNVNTNFIKDAPNDMLASPPQKSVPRPPITENKARPSTPEKKAEPAPKTSEKPPSFFDRFKFWQSK